MSPVYRDDYLLGRDIVHQLKVVNDTAERAGALIEEYNSSLTKDEDQKQYWHFIIQNLGSHFLRYRIASLRK
jgi:hypothetical protein